MKAARILIVVLLAGVSSLCAALTKTTTSLTSSLNPSTYGQPVTFTAVVTPAPPDGESVAFVQGKNVLGTGSLSGGTATFTTSTLSGTNKIKAEYSSDGTYGGSTSNVVTQVVDPAPTTTTLVSSPNPSYPGESVTFTATVIPQYGGTPTGKVFFYNGSAELGSALLSGGTANYTTTKLPTGTDSITAVYNGSTSFGGSTSNAVIQAVNTGTTIDSSMTWNNITRYYEVYLPANMGSSPAMLLMLHGTQETKSTGDNPQPVISLNWGWQPLADQNGFILVQPASTFDPNTNQWNWNAYCMDGTEACSPYGLNGGAFAYAEGCGSADSECPDDSGFLAQLIQNLTSQYNVNPLQVYVTGFSSGAEMTERVGFEHPELVAAISPASGQLVAEQGSDSSPLPFPSDPLAPISVQEWHGTEDTTLPPCNYSTTKYNGVIFTLDTVDDTFNYWSGTSADACTVFANTEPLCLNGAANPNTTGNDATGCTSNAEVQFNWEQGVAHNWQEQNNGARWTFFAKHPMPASRR